MTRIEPYIDARTMEIHLPSTTKAYIDKLNAALAGRLELADKPLEALLADLDALPTDIRTAVRNHGGGHANHTLFWTVIGPGQGGRPEGDLAAAIERAFGSFDAFKTQFADAAAGRFGSGWAWLVKDKAGKLSIDRQPGFPADEGKKPLLAWMSGARLLLKYQYRRPNISEPFGYLNWQKWLPTIAMTLITPLNATSTERFAEASVI